MIGGRQGCREGKRLIDKVKSICFKSEDTGLHALITARRCIKGSDDNGRR